MKRRINPLLDLGPRLLSVEKPARYLGGEYGSIRKEGEDLLNFALCFPDLYEIGMSNNAIRILYDGLNRLEGVRCERVFAPAPDFEALLDSAGIPLFTLESGLPLCNVDILGFSIGYELAATSMLAVLKAGGIALRSKDRGGESPIVIAGGPAISNPHPFADFLDAAYIGEAEGSFFGLAGDLAAMKTQGALREDLLERISRESAIWMPRREGRPAKSATRSIFSGFADKDYRTALPVATLRAVQDHGTVEIMRGCPNGCRFCHAGYYYRPQRIKSYERIRSEVEHLVRSGGYREITLASLSSGDFPCVGELIAALNAEWKPKNVSFQLPSLKVNSFTLPLLKELAETRKSGLTFAVETPVDDWQRGLNKDVSFEHTVSILEEAKAQGFRQAKFYFMLGLPVSGRGEGEAEALVEFFERLDQRIHLQINATIGIFVPKPHTPFQWSAQIGESEGLNLINAIRGRLRKFRNLKLSYHSPFLSLLEGVISRGDERVGGLIETAFARGARLDAWEDRFDRELWRGVLTEASWNVTADSCAPRDLDAALPWDDISIRVSKNSLKREFERSVSQTLTAACTEMCTEPCGSCTEAEHVVAFSAPSEAPGLPFGSVPSPAAPGAIAQMGTQDHRPHPGPFRMVFQYSKKAIAIYYPHLAVVEALDRALLMADLPVQYSEGFNPMPRLEVLQPLPIGVASEEEIGLLLLKEAWDTERFVEVMNQGLPAGLSVSRAQCLPARPGIKQRSLGSLLWGSEFLLRMTNEGSSGTLYEVLARVLSELGMPLTSLRKDEDEAIKILLPEPTSKERGLLRILERCRDTRPLQSWVEITRFHAFAELGAGEGPIDFMSAFARLSQA